LIDFIDYSMEPKQPKNPLSFPIFRIKTEKAAASCKDFSAKSGSFQPVSVL
jgi:hypothetical protein